MTLALFAVKYELAEALKQQSYLECERCGCCCKGRKVYVHDDEIRSISHFLSVKLRKKHGKALKMMNLEGNYIQGPCPLYKDSACLVYDARPTACAVYPLFRNPDGRLGCQLNCEAGRKMYQRLYDAYA
jgi:Fe-S-cluster containining protein